MIAHREKLSADVAGELRTALEQAGYGDAPWTSISKGSKGTKAARAAVDGGARVVLVCGGDGSVRAVAEGVAETGVALAVLPCGTANLFAGAFDIPSDPAGVVALISSGARRTIDTGRCNSMTFAVMAGAGFDAAMIDGAEDAKETLGVVSYVRSAARAARDREEFAARVSVDGKPFFDGSASCVLVGNIGRLKAGIEAFPDASVTDGKLDVAVITATGAKEWAGVLLAAVRHRQRLSGRVQLTQGARVVAKFDAKHRFELDGGTKGKATKLKLSVRPQSLVICAPPAP